MGSLNAYNTPNDINDLRAQRRPVHRPTGILCKVGTGSHLTCRTSITPLALGALTLTYGALMMAPNQHLHTVLDSDAARPAPMDHEQAYRYSGWNDADEL